MTDKVNARQVSWRAISKNKAQQSKPDRAAHYRSLSEELNALKSKVAGMQELNPKQALEFIAQLEPYLHKLKKQSGYTMLMMRVVEIGIPVLLSLFSVFFILRYTLTESRSMEIKQLLDERKALQEGK